MANDIKALGILLILGLFLRLIVINLPGFAIDMTAWAGWAQRLNQIGFSQFYSDQVWTNYTPGFLYILYFLAKFGQVFQIDGQSFLVLLKIPSLFAEIILGIVVYELIKKYSYKWALISSSFILLNPAFIFNSSVWGQIDGLLSLLLILCIYFLTVKKLFISSIFLGLSLLVKPQALLLTPVLVLFLLQSFTIKNLFALFIPAFLLLTTLSAPFFINISPVQLFSLISQMMQDYPYTSLFAYNFWGIFGFWIPDSNTFINLTYKNIGFIFYAIYWLIIIYFHLRKRFSLFTLALFATLSFFFLPTRIHERYLFPGLVFLILSFSMLKSYLLTIMAGLLSLIHLLNLYYVYVYYNEVFLNLPKVFYSPLVYSFIENNNQNFSILSLIIFILITLVIIAKRFHRDAS